MLKIYKYPIWIDDIIITQMPKSAKILTVQTQIGQVCIWALVDPELPVEPRTFRLIGTGHSIIDHEAGELAYIGTFQLHGGALVFHLFEVAG